MTLLEHLRLMAQYNQWMNEKTYASAATLTPEKLKQDRKAFFTSIFGTLNHLMVGDIIWLQRFAAHPGRHSALESLRSMAPPTALDETLHATLQELQAARIELDVTILAWCDQLSATDLEHVLQFNSMNGQAWRKPFAGLVLHMFNHQTHHRGQISTMLSQENIDVGTTDLLALVPDL